jgi:hypothetical protein
MFFTFVFLMKGNGFGYEYLRGFAFKFAGKHKAEKPRGFSVAGRKEQLLRAIGVRRFKFNYAFLIFAAN